MLLEAVELRAGQLLCESASAPTHLYFPTTAAISLLYSTEDGASFEVAVVGRDGVVGLSMFTSGAALPLQASVQSPGHGFRLCARAAHEEVDRGGPVLGLFLHYTQALFAQVAQTAACNRYHSIEQQLCRRLLLGMDRSGSNDLAMTQEGLASLLGVRREGVTIAALKLQQAGAIRYSRGRIAVLDRHRLEKRACQCYATARAEGDRPVPARLAA